MHIARAAARTSKRGPAEYFTGQVWLDEIAAGPNPARIRIVRVTFAPGSRTAWHTHPHGQLLHIVSGVGRVRKAGESIFQVYPGDTVWFEPNERHWHGAAPDCVMVHLAIQQTDSEGNSAAWFDHVTDTDYTQEPTNRPW